MDLNNKRGLSREEKKSCRGAFGGDSGEGYEDGFEHGLEDGKSGRTYRYSNSGYNPEYTEDYDEGYNAGLRRGKKRKNVIKEEPPREKRSPIDIGSQKDMNYVPTEEEEEDDDDDGEEEDGDEEDGDEEDEDDDGEEEDEGLNPNFEDLCDEDSDDEDEKPNSYMNTLNKQFEERKKSRQERWNTELTKELVKNDTQDEEKDTEYTDDSITDNINKGIKAVSFKKEDNSRVKDLNKLPFSLYFLFSKLSLFGIDKKEAENLIKNIDISVLEKLSAIFSMVEIDNLNLLHYHKVFNFLKSIDNVGFSNNLSNNLLLECLRGANLEIHNCKFTKIVEKIAFNNINFGIIDKKYIDQVDINSLKETILKSKKQYSFLGNLIVTGENIQGYAIPMEKVYNPKAGNILKIGLRLGTIYYSINNVEYLFLVFSAKDIKGNDYILIIK